MASYYQPGTPSSGILEDADNYDWTDVNSQSGDQTDPNNSTMTDPLSESFVTAPVELNPPRDRSSSPIPNPPLSLSRPKRVTDETAHETSMRLSNEFEPLFETDADTLVYIGVPPQASGQDSYEYEFVKRRFEQPFLMRSSTLRSLGSAKFDKFLGPMSARTERKLKKQGIHKFVKQPETIKYYIDLSPIINDDEALIQITELTVPHGALLWHQTAKEYNVPASHVCGRDDLNVPKKPIYELLAQEAEEAESSTQAELQSPCSVSKRRKSRGTADKENEDRHLSEHTKPPEEEYTALRHHTAIVRLLYAIAGNDPKLNSAPKAWTYCMLAKYFDCAQNADRVNHWIISWLLENGNCHFIQCLPDVAYRIAVATQSQWLMRCTFAILVGQQAMIDGAAHRENSTGIAPRKFHVAESLDDDEINRLDHAAEALIQRMKGLFEELTVSPGLWNADASSISELSKLNTLNFAPDAAVQEKLQNVKYMLTNYLRRMIYMTLSHQYDLNSNKSVPPFKAFRQWHDYADIPRPLRLLTQQFWLILRLENLPRDYSDTQANREIWEATQQQLRDEGIICGPYIPYISRKQLFTEVDKLNAYLWSQHRRPTPDPASPLKKVKLSLNATSSVALNLPTFHYAAENAKDMTGQQASRNSWAEARDGCNPLESRQYQQEDEDWVDVGKSLASFQPLPFRQKSQNEPPLSALDIDVDDRISQVSNRPSEASQQPFAPPPPASKSYGTLSTAEQSLVRNLYGSVGQSTGSSSTGQAFKDTLADDPFIANQTVGNLNQDAKSETLVSRAHGNRNIADLSICSDSETTLSAPYHFVLPAGRHDQQTSQQWINPQNPWTQVHAQQTIEPAEATGPVICAAALLQELQEYLYERLAAAIEPGYVTDRTCDIDIPVGNISTLLCLTDDEWKYLPLWAGGLDDGTGGVFNDGVEPPDAPDVGEGGFRGGAIGIVPGVGSSIGGSASGAGSEFEEITTEVGVSTVGKASRLATDGTATETVMSLDE